MDITPDSTELELAIEKHEGDSQPIVSQTNEYNRKLDDVKKQVLKRTEEQRKKVKVQRQFLKTLKEVEEWQTITANQLAVYGPVKETPEDVKDQLEKINVSMIMLVLIHIWIPPLRLLSI